MCPELNQIGSILGKILCPLGLTFLFESKSYTLQQSCESNEQLYVKEFCKQWRQYWKGDLDSLLDSVSPFP